MGTRSHRLHYLAKCVCCCKGADWPLKRQTVWFPAGLVRVRFCLRVRDVGFWSKLGRGCRHATSPTSSCYIQALKQETARCVLSCVFHSPVGEAHSQFQSMCHHERECCCYANKFMVIQSCLLFRMAVVGNAAHLSCPWLVEFVAVCLP